MTPMDRRRVLKVAASMLVGGLSIGGAYPFLEAKWCRVTRCTIQLRHLPASFRGLTIALISDVHHGPFVPLAYVRHVVNLTNSLKPDLVLLAGDYVSRHTRFIEPSIQALSRMKGLLGRFAVLGNHDHWESAPASRQALKDAGIELVDNSGLWIKRGYGRLRVCGVGDLWTDSQDPCRAIGDATERDAVIMLSHNPDFAERLCDYRVGLMLSGHTHGGQVVLPGYGAPIVPSQYGQKYLHGLVQGPSCQVFVTRGVGTVTPPVRFLCRPEIALITLA